MSNLLLELLALDVRPPFLARSGQGASPVWLPPLQRHSMRSGSFFVGIPASRFMPFASRQRMSNWCWAADGQIVLGWHGVSVSQAEIVARIFGAPFDNTANLNQVLMMLSGLAVNREGVVSAISARLAQCEADVFDDLSADRPLIAGLSSFQLAGHAYVLVGATFDLNLDGSIRMVSSIVWNPAPFSAGIEELSWAEFMARMVFVVRTRVSPVF